MVQELIDSDLSTEDLIKALDALEGNEFLDGIQVSI